MFFIFRYLLLMILLWPCMAGAQGDPLFRVYRPDEYKAGPQIWDIQESKDGLLYFGTGKGILEYDGANRQIIGLPNRSGVKTLTMNNEGVIYVGGQAEFGYLTRLPTGQTAFKSLIHSLPEDLRHFEGISGIFCIGKSVYFVSSGIIFIYSESDKNISYIRSSGTFRSGFVFENDLYVNDKEKGLLLLKQTQFTAVKNAQLSLGTEIRTTIPAGEGIKIFTKKNGVLLLRNRELTLCDTCSLLNTVNAYGLYASAQLPNGHLLFATERNGLIETESSGKIIKIIGREEGMPSNLIWSLHLDMKGNLWIGTDEGFVFFPYRSPLSILDERKGQKGQVLTAKLIDEELYIGTTTGLYKKNASRADSYFEPVGDVHEQAWMVDTAGGSLLCAHVEGLLDISSAKINNLLPGFVWSFVPMGKDRLAVGTYNNPPALMVKEKGKWKFSHYLSDFKESSRYIAFDSSNNSLWIGHPHKGIIRLQLNDASDRSISTKFYNTDQGLPSNTFNFVFQGKNKVYFCTEKGLYDYNPLNDRFEKNPWMDSLLGNTPIRKIHESPTGKLWYHTGEKTGYIENKAKTEIHVLDGTGVLSMETFNSSKMMLGTASGLYFFDLSVSQNLQTNFTSQIRRVRLNKTDSLLPIEAGGKDISLAYNMNDLTINYAANWFDHNEMTAYRYKLIGYDEKWSSWTLKTEKEYTNLREGQYIFMAEARSPYGVISPPASFIFTILPPWYRTFFAWVAYFIAALVITSGSIKLYIRKNEKEKEALINLIRENTAEIRKQNASIEEKNKELLELNEEKNHLIGIVAHDLRSPLNQNKGFINIIKLTGDNLTPEQKGMLNKMEQSLTNLSVMIKNILDINAVESNKINIRLNAVNMSEILDKVCERYIQAAEKKQLKFVKEYPAQEPPAFADANYSEQVLENLISNAVKYSPHEKSIFVRLIDNYEYVRVEIQDQGPGLTEEDKSKMFGKFQRLSARPTGNETSTGLGLSIVKKYTEAMNAEVGCESEAGKGATFYVNFKKATG